MLHSLQHPNYVAAFQALGGTAMELLKEGMLDVMRRDLWDPSGGKLGTWLTTPAAAGVRTKVEGATLPDLEDEANVSPFAILARRPDRQGSA